MEEDRLIALARQAKPDAPARAHKALARKMKESASIYQAVKASAAQQRLRGVTKGLESLTDRFERAQQRINDAWLPEHPSAYYRPEERLVLALSKGLDAVGQYFGLAVAPRYEERLIDRVKERFREATLKDLESGVKELKMLYQHVDALRKDYEENLHAYRAEVFTHQGWLDVAEQRLAEIPRELKRLREELATLKEGPDGPAYEKALGRARELAEERRLYRRALSESTSAIMVKKGLIEKEQERLAHLEPMLEAIQEFSVHMDGLRQDAALYTDGALSVSPQTLNQYGVLVARVRKTIGAFNESFKESVDAFTESVPLPDGDAFMSPEQFKERQQARIKDARAFAERLAAEDLGYEQ
ncbi:hypothetical protein D6789_03430 [Candidatus Woesearchaeota archaeon]|nr:MAG: hypothetical protein D6789_03430 [Candidatus Woesearchaeota archaeon]